MANNNTIDHLYFVGSESYPRRWVDLAVATLVHMWTFTRTFNVGTEWKVYLIHLVGGGKVEKFPISATNSDWLWKKLQEHHVFRNSLLLHHRIHLTAQAWSIGGHRLENEDVVIEGTRTRFVRQELSDEEQKAYCDNVCQLYLEHWGYDDHCSRCPDNRESDSQEDEWTAPHPPSNLGELLKANLGDPKPLVDTREEDFAELVESSFEHPAEDCYDDCSDCPQDRWKSCNES